MAQANLTEFSDGLTVDEIYSAIWKSRIERRGKLDLNTVKSELYDLHFMRQAVGDVYARVTGGRVLSPTACAEEVLNAADDEVNSLVEEEIQRRVDSGLLLRVEEDFDFS